MQKKHYYFIGIGGIGMSALAQILFLKNNIVSGSDREESKATDRLRKLGIKVYIGHNKNNITKDIDEAVVSNAIPFSNPELEEAKRLKIPIKTRSEVLGKLMEDYCGIAIAGTHGKTTTTSMASTILRRANLSPTCMIGAKVHSLKGNTVFGKGKYFITEACEYKKALLDLFPKIAIITNIEADHLDCYQGLNEIIETFIKFSEKIPKEGLLIINGDYEATQKVIEKLKCKTITFGLKETNDFSIKNINYSHFESSFDIVKKNKKIDSLSLKIPGVHNILNALSVYILADYFGIKKDIIKKSLKEFKGANRRFEVHKIKKDILLIDDYAHHPTEIKATLEGIKSFFPKRKIWAIFQPHQYSRTRYFLDDFAKSFFKANVVIITDIYEARDTKKDKDSVSSLDLVKRLKDNKIKALNIKSFDKIIDFLTRKVGPKDIILIIGAGDIYELKEKLLKNN